MLAAVEERPLRVRVVFAVGSGLAVACSAPQPMGRDDGGGASGAGGGQGGIGGEGPTDARSPDAGPETPADPSGCRASAGGGGPKGKSERMAGGFRYVAYAPASYVPDRGMPLLLLMHGCYMDPSGWFSGASGLATAPVADMLADKYGFLVAAPEASDPTHCWTPEVDRKRVDAVFDDAQAAFNVCRERIYMGGASSGGGMTYYYGLLNSDRLAALGTWAGVGFQVSLDMGLPDSAKRKVPVAIQVGTADDQAYPEAKKARDELGKRGFPITFKELPGVGHIPSGEQAKTIFSDMWGALSVNRLP